MTMIGMNATNSNSVGATSNIQRAWLAHAPIGARAEGSAILVQRLAVTVEGGIGGLFGRDTITATVFPLIVILFAHALLEILHALGNLPHQARKAANNQQRAAERRVGHRCLRPGRCRWTAYSETQTN